MLIKIVSLFLVVMVVLAMFGRLRWLPGGKTIERATPKKCPSCGGYKIGAGKCPCQKG